MSRNVFYTYELFSVGNVVSVSSKLEIDYGKGKFTGFEENWEVSIRTRVQLIRESKKL